MDRYHRVEQPRPESSVINENEIRITTQGLIRNYVSYATSLLQEKRAREIVLKAMGQAISKAVAITEIVKKRNPGLHQDTTISSTSIKDVWEPIEEGLLPLETTRYVSMISISLSTEELNKSSPGYQAPSYVEQPKPLRQYNQQWQYQAKQGPGPSYSDSYSQGRGRGRVRERGRGRGRGWGGRGGYGNGYGGGYDDGYGDGYGDDYGGGYDSYGDGYGGYGNNQENDNWNYNNNWNRGRGRGRGWGYRGAGYERGRGRGGTAYEGYWAGNGDGAGYGGFRGGGGVRSFRGRGGRMGNRGRG